MAKLELEDIFGAFADSTKEYIDEVKRREEEMSEKIKKLEKENEILKSKNEALINYCRRNGLPMKTSEKVIDWTQDLRY